MASEKFIEWAKKKGIVLMFIQPGKPNQNAFVERFNRSFREEVQNANQFNSVYQAQEAADDWFRITTSSGSMSPWVMWLRWSSCLGNLLRKSLVLNCPLDRGVYGWIYTQAETGHGCITFLLLTPLAKGGDNPSTRLGLIEDIVISIAYP